MGCAMMMMNAQTFRHAIMQTQGMGYVSFWMSVESVVVQV